jgi:hypothetical protein
LTVINSDFLAAGVQVADVSALVAAFQVLEHESPQYHPTKLESAVEPQEDQERAGWLERLIILMGRDSREVIRDPGIVAVRLAMYVMLSILIGLMFWGLGDDKGDSDIIARVSIIFFVAAFMVFMSVAVLPFFVMQRGLFIKSVVTERMVF